MCNKRQAQTYTDIDMTGAVAIIMGSEAYGLSPTWLTTAHKQVNIPMFGSVDSLNLSVATALLLYEVVRQRTQVTNQICNETPQHR